MLPQRNDFRLWIYLLFILGLFLIIDDFIEHTITADTPLRHLFSYLTGHGITHRDHLVNIIFSFWYPKH